VHFLARLGVFAFSANTVTKNAPLEPSTTGCVGWRDRSRNFRVTFWL
jgi:hypothetical protein